MANAGEVHLDAVRDVASNLTLTIHLKRTREFQLRLKITGWLLLLLQAVFPGKVEVDCEESEQ